MGAIGDAERGVVHHGDNLEILAGIDDESVDLIYIDPPFNTGKVQRRRTLETTHDERGGDRTGFGGRRYRTTELAARAYDDRFEDYAAFLEPRLREAHRVLKDSGSFYFHIDYREAHGCKLLIDATFGRDNFLNEIIWAYDYGGRARDRWPSKHDTILFYAREAGRHHFDREAVERIPYMAPGLVGPEKAARGKLPTDTWWHTIVPTRGAERTGYPTQKPEGILRRIVAASCPADGLVLDPFAGSGTTGAVAKKLHRRYVGIEREAEYAALAEERLRKEDDGDLRDRMFADLVIDLFIAQVRFGAHARSFEGFDDFLHIVICIRNDRGDDDLPRRQPER